MKCIRYMSIYVTVCIVVIITIPSSLAAVAGSPKNDTASPIGSEAADVPGAQNIRVLSHMGGVITELTSQNNQLYAGFGPEFSVLDPSIMGAPQKIGSVFLPGAIQGITISGLTAFTANGSGGISILDISDSSHPIELSSLDTPGDGYAVAVGKSYAFVADGTQGLRIINIANLHAPYEANSIVIQGTVRDVLVNGNYLYLAEDINGIGVYNIANPLNPAYITTLPVEGHSIEFKIAGQYLFLADSSMGLFIFNISNPASPVVISSVQNIGYISNVDVYWPYAYVTDGYNDYLYLVDLSNIYSPHVVGSFRANTINTLRSTAVINNQAFVAASENGLVILNITNRSNPINLGRYNPLGAITGLALWQKTLYVANKHVVAIDVTDPALPELLSIGDIAGLAKSVGASGGYTYSDDGSIWPSHLKVMDFTNPYAPVLVNTIETNQLMREMKIVGGYGYIGDHAFQIADLSNPAAPIIIGNYQPIYNVNGLDIQGNLVYLAAGQNLIIIDATDKQHPVALGDLGLAYDVRGIDVDGNYAYAAWTNFNYIGGGFSIIDVSNPANPIEVSRVLTTWGAHGISVDKNTLFVGAGNQGLLMFDVSDKSNPSQIGYFDRSFGGDLVSENGIIYLSAEQGGLFILQPVTSSISGWVRGPNDAPLAGEVIQTLNDSVITDQNGYYQFDNKLPGIYTMTPVNSDGVYVPAYLEVTVPPDRPNQIFHKLPAPISTTVSSKSETMLSYTDLQGLVTQITFPRGAVLETVTATIQPILQTPVLGLAKTGHAFNLIIEKDGVPIPEYTFSTPIDISIQYSEYDVRTVIDENDLVLLWTVNDVWQDASTSCDPPSDYTRDSSANLVELPVCKSGTFSMMGPTETLLLPIVSQN